MSLADEPLRSSKFSSTPVKQSSPRSPPSSGGRNITPKSILKKPSNTAPSPAQTPSQSPHTSAKPCNTPRSDVAEKGSDWELKDLAGADGKLDVDAVSRLLGVGLGLGLVDEDAASRSATSSPPTSPIGEDMDDMDSPSDIEQSPGMCPGSCSHTFGWGAQDASFGGLAGLVGAYADVSTHVYGMPLGAIEEEMSETGSMLGSGCGDGRRRTVDSSAAVSVVSMELDSGDARYITARETMTGLSSEKSRWDESWMEGESRCVPLSQ